MPHRRILSVLAFPLALSAAPDARAGEGALGRWRTQDGRAEILIQHCGRALCGRIARILEPPKDGSTQDVHNPDPDLRGRPLLGLPVLLDFRPDGDQWRGHIYDPKSGNTYRSTLEPEGPTLRLRGCVMFLCKTQHWKRVA